MTSRGRSPRSAPPATRSQNPAPKSAPPKTAYTVTEANSTTAATVLIALAPRRSCSLGPYGDVRLTEALATLPGPAAHAAQDQDRGDPESDVQEHDRHEGDPDAGVGRRGVLHLHLLVDDPGLASDLTDRPARLEGDHGQDSGDRGGTQEPLAPREVSPEDPGGPVPQGQQEQQGPEPDHQVPREVRDVHGAGGRPVLDRHRVQALDDGGRARTRIGQDRGETRDGDAPAHRPVGVEVTQQGLRHVAAGLGHQLDGGELRRLVGVDPAGEAVADTHLDRRGDRGDGEPDDEPQPVVAVPAAAQHAGRVDRRDQEAPDEVGRDHHVSGHQRHRPVEDDAHRVDVHDRAGGVQCHALGGVHPGVRRDDRHAAEDPGEHDGYPGPEVHPRAEPAPAEDVDGDEDRLGEEEDSLEREGDAERRAPLAHEPWPQQPELEGQHGPGHRSHRERHRHVPRPALRQEQPSGSPRLRPR